MSTPSQNAIETNVQEAARNLLEAFNHASQGSGDGASVDSDALKNEVVNALRTEMQGPMKADLLRELQSAAGDASASGGDPVAACIERADEFFGADAVAKIVNGKVTEALQAVLPTLVKRLREEVESVASGGGGGGGGGAPAGIESVVNSNEMKEMLEDRFRQMLLYLKQEVIPQAMKQG